MSKLYIFGIGGTGSRVLRSLTMLLSTGVNINTDEIVPVIIDPDHAAADLTYTVELMRKYEQIRDRLTFSNNTQNQFFRTKINLNILPSVTLPIQNTQNVNFKTYIGYSNMPLNGANQALASMLFSDENLDSNMDVGFKGNPNVGSVVLNQFGISADFQNIIASFNQGDRVFIISSIFGGTGASGFPLLAKNIRSANSNWNGAGNIQNAPMGAITVLPYFDLKPNPKSEVDASTFISKTKAALTYYQRCLDEPNVLYYIGDTVSKQYVNEEGGTGQSDDAHFIELAAALSIIDFAIIPDSLMYNNSDGKKLPIIFKEFGIKGTTSNNVSINFTNLSPNTQKLIVKPLTQAVFFYKYIKEQLQNSLEQPWAKNIGVDTNFLSTDFYQQLVEFRKALFKDPIEIEEGAKDGWLIEMENNVRSFKPFNLEEKKNDLYSLVVSYKPARLLLTPSSNYGLFDQWLNDQSHELDNGATKEQQFMEIFHKATKTIIEKKLKMQ